MAVFAVDLGGRKLGRKDSKKNNSKVIKTQLSTIITADLCHLWVYQQAEDTC